MRRAAWCALFLVAAVLYVLALDAYYVGFFNDDAFYLIGARSLAQGRFAELNHPAQPPLIQYLPGYPLLLMPLAALFPGSWLPCQLLSAALGLASAAAAAWAFADDLDGEGRWLLAALCALNPLALSLSGAVLADAPFALAALLILGAVRRSWDRTEPSAWALLGAACGAAALIRPTGLALVLALPAALLWERRGRPSAAAAAGAAAVVLPWLVRNWLARGHPLLYAAELADPGFGADRLLQAGDRAAYYLGELYARTLLRWPFSAGRAAAAAGASAAGLALAARGLRRTGLDGGRRFALASALLLAGAALAWEKRSGRYLLPLVPFAAAWALAGLADRPRLRRAAAAAALLSFLPPGRAIVEASLSRSHGPARAPERTFAWVAENTAPEAVFASELDGRLYLRAGRRAVTLPRGRRAAGVARWAAASGIDFILVERTGDILRTAAGSGPHDAVPAAERRAALQGLRLVFEDAGEGTSIYAVPGG